MATMPGRAVWANPTCIESVAVPLLVSDPDLKGTCGAPVSLLDLSATIPALRLEPAPEMRGARLSRSPARMTMPNGLSSANITPPVR